jgi:hypothetical protein
MLKTILFIKEIAWQMSSKAILKNLLNGGNTLRIGSVSFGSPKDKHRSEISTKENDMKRSGKR